MRYATMFHLLLLAMITSPTSAEDAIPHYGALDTDLARYNIDQSGSIKQFLG
ncbi:hypothetical protein OAJ60_00455 [Planctomycetaceae bacterium]|nr:hypothetical protein [Planctomycetaceae bacterium]